MTIFGNLALIAVIALTLCVVPIWSSTTNPGGPDGSAVVMNPILCGARWFLLSIVLAICASRGAFSLTGVILVIAIYFVAEMIAAFCMSGQAFGLPSLVSQATVLIPLLLPAPLVAYTFWWLNLRGDGMTSGARLPAVGASAAIAALGVLVLLGAMMTGERKPKAPAPVQIPADGKIEVVLRYLEPGTSPETREAAVTAIAARPDLAAELAAVFANGTVTDGSRAARFLPEMKPGVPAELTDAYRKFADRTLGMLSKIDISLDLRGSLEFTESVLIGAQALRTHEIDGQLRALQSLFAPFPEQAAATVFLIGNFVEPAKPLRHAPAAL